MTANHKGGRKPTVIEPYQQEANPTYLPTAKIGKFSQNTTKYKKSCFVSRTRTIYTPSMLNNPYTRTHDIRAPTHDYIAHTNYYTWVKLQSLYSLFPPQGEDKRRI